LSLWIFSIHNGAGVYTLIKGKFLSIKLVGEFIMNDEIANNILKALLLLSKRIDDMNLILNNINESLAVIASLKQEETN
jgi:hypothetical protein